jgi:hypothetical protein
MPSGTNRRKSKRGGPERQLRSGACQLTRAGSGLAGGALRQDGIFFLT